MNAPHELTLRLEDNFRIRFSGPIGGVDEFRCDGKDIANALYAYYRQGDPQVRPQSSPLDELPAHTINLVDEAITTLRNAVRYGNSQERADAALTILRHFNVGLPE